MWGVTVFTCLLLVAGTFGVPSSESELPQARTFDFQNSNWNPVNWFGDSNRDKNEKQLAVLYKTIECLVTKNKEECTKIVDEARIQFEPKKKKTENSAEKPANTTKTS